MTHQDYKKNNFHKIFDITATVFIGILVIIGTIFAVAYAYGYRISFDEGAIEETGVLDVQTDPIGGDLYIGGELKGRTPKTIGSITEGIYNISVEKTGYTTWEKTVPIKSQLSTPTFAFMFLKTPVENDPYTNTTEALELSKISEDNNHIFFVTSSTSTTNSTLTTIKINDFITNKDFWDFTDNPKLLFSDNLTANQSFDLLPSHNGEYLLYQKGTLTNSNSDSVYQPSGNYLLIKTNTQNTDPVDIDLSPFTPDYSITWAEDNKHLILESEQDIYSYDITTGATILLDKKTAGNDLIWATTPYGLYYTVGEVTMNQLTATSNPELMKPYFYIRSKEIDGTNAEIALDKIYYNTDPSFIQTTDIADKPFTHSIYGTRFCGRITGLFVQPQGLGYLLETEYALYWYSIETERYTLVSDDVGTILDFSPDGEKFAYLNDKTNSLNIFILDKEDNDHLTKIGTKMIIADTSNIDANSIEWLQNSYFIAFMEDDQFKIVDIDGENLKTLYTSDTGTIELESLPIINYALDKMYIASATGDSDLRYFGVKSFTIH